MANFFGNDDSLQPSQREVDFQVSNEEIDSVKVLPSMIDPNLVSPLVSIYESRINELMRLNEQSEAGQIQLRNDISTLMKENETLHEAKLKDLENRRSNGLQNGEGTENLLLQISELQERLKYVEKERKLLVQQNETFVDEVNKSAQAKSERDVEIFHLNQNLNELKYTKVYLDQLLSEKEEAESRLILVDRELAEERLRGNDRMEALRNASDGLAHFQSLSRQLENEKKDLLLQLDDQSDALSEKVKTFAERIRELQAKLSKKQHECEMLQGNERTLQRDLEQLKMDNKGMVQLMNGMEKKLSEFMGREERTEKIARECKEAAEKAMLEKDQKVASETYLRGELERLRDMRVKEFEERAKQHKEAMAVVKDDCNRLLRAKEDTIKRLHEDNERLNVGYTLATHDKESMEIQLSQVSATLDNERRMVKGRCNGLEERLIAAEDRAMALQHELEKAHTEHRSEQLKLERSQREVARRQQELEEKRGKLEGDYAELEQTLELTVVAKERAEHDKAALMVEKEMLLSSSRRADSLEQEAREKAAQVEDLTQKLAQLKMQHTNETTQNQIMKDNLQAQILFLKNDKTTQEDVLRDQLKREREIVTVLTKKSMESNVKCGELASEISEMKLGYREAIEKSSELESAHEDACRRISELSIRLAECGTKEQRHIREESRLKSELAKLRFSVPGHQQQDIENIMPSS